MEEQRQIYDSSLDDGASNGCLFLPLLLMYLRSSLGKPQEEWTDLDLANWIRNEQSLPPWRPALADILQVAGIAGRHLSVFDQDRSWLDSLRIKPGWFSI